MSDTSLTSQSDPIDGTGGRDATKQRLTLNMVFSPGIRRRILRIGATPIFTGIVVVVALSWVFLGVVFGLRADDQIKDQISKFQEAAQKYSQFQTLQGYMYAQVATGNKASWKDTDENIKSRFDNLSHDISEILSEADTKNLPENIAQSYSKASKSWEHVVTQIAELKQLTAQNQNANEKRITDLRNELLNSFDETHADFEEGLEGIRVNTLSKGNSMGRLRDHAFTVAIIATILGSIILVIFIRTTSRRMGISIKELEKAFEHMSNLDLTYRAKVTAKDELGMMANDYNQAAQKIASLTQNAVALTDRVLDVGDVLLTDTLNTAQSTNKAVDHAKLVSKSAHDVSVHIDKVSKGAREMDTSILSISANANEAASVAREATSMAQITNQRVAQLGESSKEISEVISTINAVAEQTNLLALNATIEAARAGDAGKGFAVVASEVKDLAAETGRATEDIANRIEQIQVDTVQAVEAIQEVSDIISSINTFQTTIAAAVEEQTATTNEMTGAVEEAAQGANEIARNMDDISKKTTIAGKDIDQAGEELERAKKVTKELRELLADYTY